MTENHGQKPAMANRKSDAVHADTFNGQLAIDCRHYLGHSQCRFKRSCPQCTYYQPIGPRLCVIKSGPLAELLAAVSVLPELRRRFRESHVTWVTGSDGLMLLHDHPWLDRLLPLDAMTALRLPQEQFELTINLDLDIQACALEMAIFAHRRWGIGLSPSGMPMPLSKESSALMPWLLNADEEAEMTLLSYARRVSMALGLEWRGDRLILPMDAGRKDQSMMKMVVQGWMPNLPTLGLDAGLLSLLMEDSEQATGLTQSLTELLSKHEQVQLLLLSPMDSAANRQPKAWDRMLQMLRYQTRQSISDRVFVPQIDGDPRAYLTVLDAVNLLLCGPGPAAAAALGIGKRFMAIHATGISPCVEPGELGTMLTLGGSQADRLRDWQQVVHGLMGSLGAQNHSTHLRSRAA